MVAVVAALVLLDFNDLAELTLFQSQTGLFHGGVHLHAHGGVGVHAAQIAVGVGIAAAVLAVLLHQLVKQGDGVVAVLELLENVLNLGQLLGGVIGDGGGGGGGSVALSGGVALDGGLLGHQQNVLEEVALLVLFQVGQHLVVGGVAVGALAEAVLHDQSVILLRVAQAGVQILGQGEVPQGVLIQLLRASLLAHLLQSDLEGVLVLLAQLQAVGLGLLGQQSVQGGILHGSLLHAVGQGAALGLSGPGQLGLGGVGAIILAEAVGAVGDPVQQLVSGDLGLTHGGHHGVGTQSGGGQIGVGHGGQVDGLGHRGLLCAAAAQAANAQRQGQAQSQRTFHKLHKTDFLSISKWESFATNLYYSTSGGGIQ